MLLSTVASLAPSLRRARRSCIQGLRQAFDDGGIAVGALGGIQRLHFVLHDDALEREQPVDARRRQTGFLRDLLGDLDGGGQRGGIELEPARALLRFDGQRRLQIAAPEPLTRQHARGRFDAVESRRRAQAQFEPAAVDALISQRQRRVRARHALRQIRSC